MSIPNSQLDTWANPGALAGARDAHTSVRNALQDHDWPEGMSYNAYLQGSYANSTNIRGDSDVDLVVECDSFFYSNLSEEEKEAKGFISAKYGWGDFRNEVYAALTSYYGDDQVESSSKCLTVSGTSSRLAVDAVVAAEYRRYSDGRHVANGIVFWSDEGRGPRIVNYPKIHIDNGSSKNARTNERFKPMVRILKNARLHIPLSDAEIARRYPSYFVECLVYNAPDPFFVAEAQDRILRLLEWFVSLRDDGGLDELTDQCEQHYLVGDYHVQWDKDAIVDFINRMIQLWNGWS